MTEVRINYQTRGPRSDIVHPNNFMMAFLSTFPLSSKRLAVQNGCTSIAFSALSTGVYGYPSEEAAETAIAAVKGWLDADEERSGKIERIVFCSFLAKDERAYEKFIP